MKNRYQILIPLMLAGVISTIDSSIVNLAMPTLAQIFDVDMQMISWISTTYLLVIAGLLLTSGRLGDIYGYKKPFEAGVLIFFFGTIFCALAPSLAFLIAARAFQAIGASLYIAAIPPLITASFPPEERGRAMGFYVVAVSIGLSLGPFLGGWLLSKFVWRSIFIINLPVAAAAFITSKIYNKVTFKKKESVLDYGGMILAFILLSSLIFYINRGSTIGFTSNLGLFLLLISICSFAAFIFRERKFPAPMLDLAIFSNNSLVTGLFCTFLYFVAQIIMTFLMPFLMSTVGYNSFITGLAVMSFPLTMMIFAPVGGHLTDKLEPSLVSAIGGIIAALSLLLLSSLPLSFSHIDIIWRMAIFGIGGGLFETSNSVIILSSAPKHRQGIASGIMAMMRYIGMVFGIAAGGAFSSIRSEYHLQIMENSNKILELATVIGIKESLFLASLCALVCAAISYRAFLRIKGCKGADEVKLKKKVLGDTIKQ